MPRRPDEPPLIVHVIYRLDVGGLENGLINIINGLPEGRFRHAIICLTDYTDFSRRIHPPVELIALNKQPGHHMGLYWRLFKILRRLRPDILHTRNLAALEAQAVGWLAGIKHRVHGLHGWDISDLDGENQRYQHLYRIINPLVKLYIPLSNDLQDYLLQCLRVSPQKARQICNGVDTERFVPVSVTNRALLPPGFCPDNGIVMGTVGRLEVVKDQMTLVDAFIMMLDCDPALRQRARLVLVGDGSLKSVLIKRIHSAGIESLVWLAGSRHDVPALLQNFDVFVLPSQAEGISNTLLEAMASGLPVVATDVGGNRQLVESGKTGLIVQKQSPAALAEALNRYFCEPGLMQQHAAAARRRAVANFSLKQMISQYQRVYEEMLQS